MQEIILEEDYLKAKKGDIYIKGLYGVPTLYKMRGENNPEDWWWKKDSKKEDNDYIYYKNIKQLNKNICQK